MFQGLANLGSIWKQASQLGGQLKKLDEELKQRRTSGAAGGGMVEMEINGALEVLRCKIDPQLLAQGDSELLEDLIVAAVNQAVTKAREIHAEAVRDLAGGLQLPGMKEAMEKIGGLDLKET